MSPRDDVVGWGVWQEETENVPKQMVDHMRTELQNGV